MRAHKLLSVAVLVGLSSFGCSKTSGPRAAKEDMQLVPKETDVVLMANLTRMRSSALWKRVIDFRDSNAETKKGYEEFVQKCALDPFKQVDSAFVALPQDVQNNKEFAV